MNTPNTAAPTVVPDQEDADIHSASDEYAARFAGRVGAYFLQTQTNALLSLITPLRPTTVLDVGGGHGQVALPLLAKGLAVTVVASGANGFGQLGAASSPGLTTSVGSLIDLPFPDKSFDLVSCFRILPHCRRWPQLISELCRVARHGVVVDFPVAASLNVLTPLLFSWKKQIEQNTRDYELFSVAQIQQHFSSHGFESAGVRRQFFWPMALHRALKSAPLSKTLEGGAELLGLTRLLGSPVVALYRRR